VAADRAAHWSWAARRAIPEFRVPQLGAGGILLGVGQLRMISEWRVIARQVFRGATVRRRVSGGQTAHRGPQPDVPSTQRRAAVGTHHQVGECDEHLQAAPGGAQCRRRRERRAIGRCSHRQWGCLGDGGTRTWHRARPSWARRSFVTATAQPASLRRRALAVAARREVPVALRVWLCGAGLSYLRVRGDVFRLHQCGQSSGRPPVEPGPSSWRASGAWRMGGTP
jgi:hypothetical protein